MEVEFSCTKMPGQFTIGRAGKKLPVKDGVIRWHINNFTDKLPKHKTILAVEKAFHTWEQALHPIRFETTSDHEQAQIKISFTPTDHDRFDNGKYKIRCGVKFDGPGGVLAHAYFASPELHLDESEDWSEAGIHLLSVLIHEIGHNLNIGHSEVKEAIMYPTYTGPKTTLHADDIRAVHTVYAEERKKLCANLGIDYYESQKKKKGCRMW